MTYSFYLFLLYKRFIPLYVDNHIPCAANLFYGLLNTVGATLMVVSCHYRFPAERFHTVVNAFVVCSHIGFIENTCNLFVNTLYDSFSSKNGQWFAGETG